MTIPQSLWDIIDIGLPKVCAEVARAYQTLHGLGIQTLQVKFWQFMQDMYPYCFISASSMKRLHLQQEADKCFLGFATTCSSLDGGILRRGVDSNPLSSLLVYSFCVEGLVVVSK